MDKNPRTSREAHLFLVDCKMRAGVKYGLKDFVEAPEDSVYRWFNACLNDLSGFAKGNYQARFLGEVLLIFHGLSLLAITRFNLPQTFAVKEDYSLPETALFDAVAQHTGTLESLTWEKEKLRVWIGDWKSNLDLCLRMIQTKSEADRDRKIWIYTMGSILMQLWRAGLPEQKASSGDA